jgi:hypothetical protein
MYNIFSSVILRSRVEALNSLWSYVLYKSVCLVQLFEQTGRSCLCSFAFIRRREENSSARNGTTACVTNYMEQSAS